MVTDGQVIWRTLVQRKSKAWQGCTYNFDKNTPANVMRSSFGLFCYRKLWTWRSVIVFTWPGYTPSLTAMHSFLVLTRQSTNLQGNLVISVWTHMNSSFSKTHLLQFNSFEIILFCFSLLSRLGIKFCICRPHLQ